MSVFVRIVAALVVATASSVHALDFRDVNIFVLTDTHSWVDGHPHKDHIPSLDATYGNITSFVTRMKEKAAEQKKDIFFLDNGDVVDGTGLSNASPIDGEELFPILMNVPFDAMAIGNHECYGGDTIQSMIDTGYIANWNGRYLTGNVLLTSTMQPLGDRYVVLEGAYSGVRLLVLGMLYNMEDNTPDVTVETVEDTIVSDWFVSALSNEKYDAVAVLFHVDYSDPLVSTLLGGIRAVAGDRMPVQFLTGHSHINAYNEPDSFSANLEAGFYAGWLGYASFDLPRDTEASSMLFYHDFITSNLDEMHEVYESTEGTPVEGDFMTPLAYKIDEQTTAQQAAMNLSYVLGCTDVHYHSAENVHNDNSLYGLFLHQVIPSQLFTPPFNTSGQILMQGTGALRYDLFAGQVSVDDIWTLSPFNDPFFVIRGVPGASILAANIYLNQQDPMALFLSRDKRVQDKRFPFDPRLPNYLTTSMPVPIQTYDLFVGHFDSSYVVQALLTVTGVQYDLEPYGVEEGLASTYVWFDWAGEYLSKC